MASPLIYQINSYTLEQLPAEFEGMKIKPLVGNPTDTAPFILYQWLPAKVNSDKYFQRRDIIVYNVYDNDYDRLFRLTEELEDIFNVMDGIQGQIDSDSYRILWSEFRGGTPTVPIEREGWGRMIFEFWIGYVPLDPEEEP